MNTEVIESKIGYVFKNKELCKQAFCHSSYAFANNVKDNEVLEFFGDSVLNFIVTEYLCISFEGKTEGQLSKIKARSVSTETLSRIIEDLGLEKQLLSASSEHTAKHSKRMHAGLFEALLAAIFLDGGMEQAKQFALRFVKPHVDRIASSDVYDDYKTALQEYAQNIGQMPVYEIISKTGPDHDPRFCCKVTLDGIECTGSGGTKAEAQFEASKNAYLLIKERQK